MGPYQNDVSLEGTWHQAAPARLCRSLQSTMQARDIDLGQSRSCSAPVANRDY